MLSIVKSWNNRQIRIRGDRYVNLTDMAQACGKRFPDWNRLESAKSYLETLSGMTEKPIKDLIQITQGGPPEKQGTWGHSYVAIEFARWANPEFGIWCNIHLQDALLESFEGRHNHKDLSGFVYLARTPNGWCKIGMSETPYRRMTALQVGTPLEITLVHRIFTLNMSALEKALHEYFEAYWMRGEWFDLPEECVKDFPAIANELDADLELVRLPESI